MAERQQRNASGRIQADIAPGALTQPSRRQAIASRQIHAQMETQCALRIHIDQQHLMPRSLERYTEIHRDCCLANSPFGRNHRDYFHKRFNRCVRENGACPWDASSSLS